MIREVDPAPRALAMDATLAAATSAAPDTLHTKQLYETVAALRELRAHVRDHWFTMSREDRNSYRTFPLLDEERALASLSAGDKAAAAFRVAYHRALGHDDYFVALRSFYREGVHLANEIRARIAEEQDIQGRLAAEVRDGEYVPKSCEPAGRVSAIPLDTAAIRRRREARRSNATS